MFDTIYFKIFYVIISYFLGSVLLSYVMAKIYGGKDEKKNLSEVDRPGTAGVGRQYGIKAGLPTFLFDMGKGIAVPMVGQAIGLDPITIAIACVAVLVGHNWPLWYEGGGGLATTMGIAGVLMLVPFFIVFGISLVVGVTYKYTLGRKHRVNPNVVGGALGAFLLPVFAYIYDQPLTTILLFVAIFLIILTRGLVLHFMYRKIPTANKF